ncbi:MAG TPA: beta-N-acetylhexosaminidase, partial [Mariniflexile sp.]|nr:beta-N-acetylhexosaminidase [Mariniflexile sp.]
MKNPILILLFFVGLSCATKPHELPNPVSDYHIIPQPVFMEMLKGRFLVNSKTAVAATNNLEKEGRYLADLLSQNLNTSVAFQSGSSAAAIQLKLDTSILEDEGYTVSVTSQKIIVAGKTAKGVFYGIQTLRQLLPTAKVSTKNFTIPAVKIQDYPRFSYRGMHLDVGRHIFPLDFIKKYIDLIA